ncbi:shikimate dehydrogenase [Natronospira sp.]|uniref:shikimate dehydrogenase n=1 Tax=Natronospira sp. TaxID=2024970 RepID=UPI0038737CE8
MNQSSARYAVFGHPIGHSRSPEIHHHFAETTGRTIHYERIDPGVDGFESAVSDFFQSGAQGANVTLPFKERAFHMAEALSDRARLARSVNTLAVGRDGRLIGDNTDGVGLVRDLTANLGFSLEGKRLLLIGAGGAARGVLGPLLESGVEALYVANRTRERAQQLAQDFRDTGPVSGGGLDDLPNQLFDLILNATAASLSGDNVDLPHRLFAPHCLCYDMSYATELSPFLQQGIRHGAHVADGWGMLVEQAAESFQIWHGIRPDTADLLEW